MVLAYEIPVVDSYWRKLAEKAELTGGKLQIVALQDYYYPCDSSKRVQLRQKISYVD